MQYNELLDVYHHIRGAIRDCPTELLQSNPTAVEKIFVSSLTTLGHTPEEQYEISTLITTEINHALDPNARMSMAEFRQQTPDKIAQYLWDNKDSNCPAIVNQHLVQQTAPMSYALEEQYRQTKVQYQSIMEQVKANISEYLKDDPEDVGPITVTHNLSTADDEMKGGTIAPMHRLKSSLEKHGAQLELDTSNPKVMTLRFDNKMGFEMSREKNDALYNTVEKQLAIRTQLAARMHSYERTAEMQQSVRAVVTTALTNLKFMLPKENMDPVLARTADIATLSHQYAATHDARPLMEINQKVRPYSPTVADMLTHYLQDTLSSPNRIMREASSLVLDKKVTEKVLVGLGDSITPEQAVTPLLKVMQLYMDGGDKEEYRHQISQLDEMDKAMLRMNIRLQQEEREYQLDLGGPSMQH